MDHGNEENKQMKLVIPAASCKRVRVRERHTHTYRKREREKVKGECNSMTRAKRDAKTLAVNVTIGDWKTH